jgi:hypothetical protein
MKETVVKEINNITCYSLKFCKNKLIARAIYSNNLKFNNKGGRTSLSKCLSPDFEHFKEGENNFILLQNFQHKNKPNAAACRIIFGSKTMHINMLWTCF